MTDESAFLATIRDLPDDDAPRLVYADWLEEHGSPERAEWIRLQCQQALTPEADPQIAEITHRLAVLTKSHVPLWNEEEGTIGRPISWRRGFIEEINVSLDNLIDSVDEIRECYPTLKAIRVQDLRSSRATALTKSPIWKDLSKLSVSFLDPESMPFLLRTPLENLKYLSLAPAYNMTGSIAASLSECAHLKNVTHLKLHQCAIGLEELQRFNDSPHWANLRHMQINLGTRIQSFSEAPTNLGIAELQGIARLPLIQRLETLELTFNPIGGLMSRIIDSGIMDKVTKLDLGHKIFSIEDISHLVLHPLPHLEELCLSFGRIGVPGVDQLGKAASQFPNLRKLNLSHNNLGDTGALKLMRSKLATQLIHLDLSLNQITDKGAQSLAKIRQKFKLIHLDLIYNPISFKVQKDLAKRFGPYVCIFER